jgi:hypothetical protein
MGLFSDVFPDLSAEVERIKQQQRQQAEEVAVNQWMQDVGVKQLHYTPQQLINEFRQEGLTHPNMTRLGLIATLAPRLAIQRALANQTQKQEVQTQSPPVAAEPATVVSPPSSYVMVRHSSSSSSSSSASVSPPATNALHGTTTVLPPQSKPSAAVTVASIGHQLQTNPQLLAAAVAGGLAGFFGAGVDASIGTRILLTGLGAGIPVAAHAAIVM